jgi:hypothetical protein
VESVVQAIAAEDGCDDCESAGSPPHFGPRAIMNSMFTFLAQAAPSNGGSGGAIVAGGFFFVIVGLVILTSIFWLWMLIDCLMSTRPPMEKLVWIVVILFLHILGAALYFFIARGGRSRSTL